MKIKGKVTTSIPRPNLQKAEWKYETGDNWITFYKLTMDELLIIAAEHLRTKPEYITIIEKQ